MLDFGAAPLDAVETAVQGTMVEASPVIVVEVFGVATVMSWATKDRIGDQLVKATPIAIENLIEVQEEETKGEAIVAAIKLMKAIVSPSQQVERGPTSCLPTMSSPPASPK